MARLLFILGLLFIGAAVGAAYVAHPRIPSAVFCEKPILNLGKLRQKEEATGSFMLINGTRKSAKILGISESCDCTVSQVSANMLEPGQKSIINVKWSTGSRRGKAAVELWAGLEFEDGPHVAVTMMLQGEIIPEYNVEPPEARFEIGACEKQIVRFSPSRMNDVYVKHVLCSHRCLSAKILPDMKSVEISVVPDQWNKGANFTPWVSVTTNSDRVPTTQIWCQIN